MKAGKKLFKRFKNKAPRNNRNTSTLQTGEKTNDKGIKLNIGGGKGHPDMSGWHIVDLRENADIVMDITRDTLPFDDNSVDIIYSSHTLEHIYVQDLPFVLKEIYRVIKPETGIIRLVVPDIKKACQAYLENDFSFFKKSSLAVFDEKSPIGGHLMSWFYSVSKVGNGHVHCFDFEYMFYLLKNAGFRYVFDSKYRTSECMELRKEGFDLERHRDESLYIECRK